MANEYLRRTNTSTGNRRVWTWSSWIKINKDFGASDYNTIFSVSVSGDDRRLHFYHTGGFFQLTGSTGSVKFQSSSSIDVLFRDCGSWAHICVAANTPAQAGADRLKFYINGAQLKSTEVSGGFAQNSNLALNFTDPITIGARQDPIDRFFDGEMFDVFLVDGQALTPDVFGYYKKGDGYISAGTSQATDFKKGQWVPKAPKIIKSIINARGGFGVNGFYLPMNDSNNFGADFHCEPNSIIKLKGEEDPQPRSGAPTTTDAYVSQLRTDLLKDYLVLAVPGISTATGPNLITNGTFDSNTTGWVAGNDATLSVSNSALRITSSASVINGFASQAITTVIGQRYTVSFDVVDSSNSSAWVRIGTTSGGVQVSSRNNNAAGHHNISFTATATTTYIAFMVTVGIVSRYTVVDNIVVKQENPPRDYSANIKGSGTNKTLTAAGDAGVGYEIPSYYGSALSFDGNGDYFTIPDTEDFEFGFGDYTVEFWVNCQRAISGTLYFEEIVTKGYPFQIYRSNTGSIFFACDSNTSVYDINSSFGTPGVGDWAHVCVERYNGLTSMYLNGVVGATSTASTSINNTGSALSIGDYSDNLIFPFTGYIQDLRIYKGVAKYKGSFDVPKPYTPVGIATWRAVPDTIANNFANQQPTNGNWAQTLTDGNLTQVASSNAWNTVRSNIGIGTGKYYWEVRLAGTNNATMVGVDDNLYSVTLNPSNAYVGFYANSWSCYLNNGQIRNTTGSGSTYGSSFAQGDICMVAVDATSGKIYWGKNGTWFNSGNPATGTNAAYSNLTGYSHLMPAISVYDTNSAVNINFGQNPTFSGTTTAGTFTDSSGKGLFKYQPPSDFLALCEDNLPTPAISDPGKYFKTVLYTGDGANGRGITGVGFQPDLIWIKNRDAASWHVINDSVRGPNKALYSNQIYAENQTISNPVLGSVLSFDNDGFTLAADPDANSNNGWNTSGNNFVAWCWKSGGLAVTNTNGSITSVVSVNQNAGFSIVSYTGNSSSPVTIGHGLGKKPAFIIVKNRDVTSTWYCYHQSLGPTVRLSLESTAAAFSGTGLWNSTEPSSTVFTTVSDTASNNNGSKHIAYCWAEIEGFSKFGSYVGNGSTDGPFVYCGFKPAWVMIKNISGTHNWEIYDSSMNPINPVGLTLLPNASDTQIDTTPRLDFLSNGFKWRNIGGSVNGSGNTIIFAAFAESPFQTANAK
jgi:hypothetical protein